MGANLLTEHDGPPGIGEGSELGIARGRQFLDVVDICSRELSDTSRLGLAVPGKPLLVFVVNFKFLPRKDFSYDANRERNSMLRCARYLLLLRPW